MFPWDFEFNTPRTLPKDERPPPEAYSVDDANTINANRIPLRAYPEEFLVHMGISHNYFGSPVEVPTFLDENSRGGCSSFFRLQIVVVSILHIILYFANISFCLLVYF